VSVVWQSSLLLALQGKKRKNIPSGLSVKGACRALFPIEGRKRGGKTPQPQTGPGQPRMGGVVGAFMAEEKRVGSKDCERLTVFSEKKRKACSACEFRRLHVKKKEASMVGWSSHTRDRRGEGGKRGRGAYSSPSAAGGKTPSPPVGGWGKKKKREGNRRPQRWTSLSLSSPGGRIGGRG